MWFRSPAWDSVAYWALDLETGGLDAKRDAIIAIGMVPIRGGVIRVGESWRTLVRPEPGTRIDPGSVHAHQLVSGDLSDAPPLDAVLPEVDRRLREGALLVHHKAIDVSFLRREYRRLGLPWPSPVVVDTVDLLVRRARITRPEVPREALVLQLGRARREFGLPNHGAHDALGDAIATAELFLVVRAALGARTLRDLR